MSERGNLSQEDLMGSKGYEATQGMRDDLQGRSREPQRRGTRRTGEGHLRRSKLDDVVTRGVLDAHMVATLEGGRWQDYLDSGTRRAFEIVRTKRQRRLGLIR